MANPQNRTHLLNRVLFPLLAVAVGLAAHQPQGWTWLLAVVVYTPLYGCLAREPSWWVSILVGWILGMVQVMVLASWTVTTLENPGVKLLLLGSVNGLLWATAAGVLWLLLRWHAWPPLIWAVIPGMEWARLHNPWISAGYLLTAHGAAENLWLLQWCLVLGCWGLSYLLCATSWWTWRMIETRGSGLFCWAFTLAGLHVAGGGWLWYSESAPTKTAEIAVVQEYAPRPMPGEAESPRDPTGYAKLCQNVLDRYPTAVLFLPEGQLYQPLPMPGVTVTSSAPQPQELAAFLGDRFAVAGVILPQLARKETYRNAIAILTHAGLGETVDKRFPAPIGEEGHLVFRQPNPVLRCPNGWRLGIIICSEQTDPDIWDRKHCPGSEELDLQVIFADSRWFHYSPIERHQSRAARKLLAIAYQRPVVLVANGGSEWIDCAGRVRQAFPAEASTGLLRVAWNESQPPLPRWGGLTGMGLILLLWGAGAGVRSLLVFLDWNRQAKEAHLRAQEPTRPE